MDNNTNASSIGDGLPVYMFWLPMALEFVFGVGGNAIAVLMLIRTRREHKWQSFYKLYCGLAVTDFLCLLLGYPVSIMRYASGFEWSIKSVPGLCDLISFVWMWGLLSTGLIICAMSIDRLYTVFFTNVFHTYHRNSDRKYTLVLVGIWLFSASIALLPVVGVGHNETFFPGSWCFFAYAYDKNVDNNTDVQEKAPTFIVSYIYSIIGLLIVGISTVTSLITISAICQRKSRAGILFDARQVAGQSEMSILIFLTTLFIVFVSFWTPLMINIFQHATGTLNGEDTNNIFVLRLTILNSIIDPWIYIMSQKEVLNFIKRFFRICRRTTSSDGEKHSLIADAEIRRT